MALRVYNGRYEIVQHLARGGMAEVFLARDLLLDRPVAIKVLFPEFAADRSFVERFRREARSAANLNHPNIVSIYDWGEEEGTYFIVMEYVEGRTLRQMIREDGPVPPRRAAEIGADIAAALGFVLYEMVVGRPPFYNENPVAVAYQHVRERPIPPRQHNPKIPVPFEAIVLKSLAKNPVNRYASAEELRADLLRFRAGRPVLATPAAGAAAAAGATTAMPAVDSTQAIPAR